MSGGIQFQFPPLLPPPSPVDMGREPADVIYLDDSFSDSINPSPGSPDPAPACISYSFDMQAAAKKTGAIDAKEERKKEKKKSTKQIQTANRREVFISPLLSLCAQ